MKQLTLRGFDKKIERRIRDVAKQEKISLNKAALRLIERGADSVDDTKPIGHSMDRFIGSMTTKDAEAIMESVRYWDAVDLASQR